MIGIAGNAMALMGGGSKPKFIAAADNSQRGTSGTGRSVTVTIPAGARAGDLLLVFATANGVNTKTIALPSGWTNIQNQDAGGTAVASYRFMYRVMAPGDTGITITSSDGLVLAATMQVWRGAGLGNRQLSGGDGSNVASAIASTTAGSSLAVFSQFNVSNTDNLAPSITGPSGTAEASELTNGGLGGCAHWSGHEAYLAGGSTGTRTFTDNVTGTAEFWRHMLQEIVKA